MAISATTADIILRMVVYIPLTLLAIAMIFAFFAYKGYEKVFTFFKFIGNHIINGAKFAYNFVMDNKFLVLLSLGCIISLANLITLSASNTYVNQLTQTSWGPYIIATLIGITVLSVCGLYVALSKDARADFPSGETFSKKAQWTASHVKKTVWYTILVGLLLALICGLIYAFSHLEGTTGGVIFNIAFAIGVLGLMFLAYGMASKNPTVRYMLNNNIIFNALYHLIFIIPCVFWWTAKAMYKEFSNTPKHAFILLGLEILFILGFFLIPIIKKYLFTFSFGKDSKEEIIRNKINSLTQTRDMYIELNNKTKASLDVNWTKILNRNLNNKPELLERHLIAMGYDSEKKKGDKYKLTISEVTKLIHEKIPRILANEKYIEETNYEIEKLNKQLEDIEKTLTGVTLLNKPIPLDVEKTIGTYENLEKNNSSDYNYNYAISCWVFLHNYGTNLSPAYVVDTSLLNYGNRPNIMWNAKSGRLKIKMKDVNNNILTIYKTDKIKLQKWTNIVINYNGGTLDVFIDGKLVSSNRNIVPYMSYDKITVGKDAGISGGICNVTYYNNILTKNQIEIYYNLLKNKNPPIV